MKMRPNKTAKKKVWEAVPVRDQGYLAGSKLEPVLKARAAEMAAMLDVSGPYFYKATSRFADDQTTAEYLAWASPKYVITQRGLHRRIERIRQPDE